MLSSLLVGSLRAKRRLSPSVCSSKEKTGTGKLTARKSSPFPTKKVRRLDKDVTPRLGKPDTGKGTQLAVLLTAPACSTQPSK